jgi:predicted RNase H-like HicB family nuclease
MTQDHFTYRVTWSPEDGDHVGLCAEFPSLSWLAATLEGALAGIRKVVAEAVRDMEVSGEKVPEPIADRAYSGEFKVRIPPQGASRSRHASRAEQGVSWNRLASAKPSA